MARPKADDPEARARIAAAAEELFAARGFDGTAIRDIARSAGVNGAMIHYYFGNKEGLYRAMLEGAAKRIQALLIETASGSGSTRDRLAHFVDAYAAYMLSQPNIARILYREVLTGARHIKQIAQQYAATNYTMLRATITDGIKRGELRAIDAELAPISLMGMVVIFQFLRPIISVALGKTEYDERFVSRVAAHTIELFLYGAAADQETASRKKALPAQQKRKSGKRRLRVQS
jgi:TetR/AcrR family transcriptional regulator